MRVLVTRPEPGASATAARLRVLGHEPILLPLSRISPVAIEELPDPGRFDAVVLTSANAVARAPEGLAARYRHLPCLAVGERTAEAARKAGFAKVEAADGDVYALVGLVAARLPAGARLLYLCGRRRRPVLEDGLDRLDYAVTALETYRTEPVDYGRSDIEAALGDGPVDAALVYSQFGAERLAVLHAAPALASRFEGARIICMSNRVAAGLPERLKSRAETAETPDEDALIALLGRAP